MHRKHGVNRTLGGHSRRRFRLQNTPEESNGRLEAVYMYHANAFQLLAGNIHNSCLMSCFVSGGAAHGEVEGG